MQSYCCICNISFWCQQMYAEYKTIHTKCISLLNVLNHARLPEFFCYTKILQMAKNIFTSIHFDSLKILTCMANSADGIMLIAKKSSAHILSHFWEVFLIALYYGLCTCSIVIKKAKTPLCIWKKYIILSLYLMKIFVLNYL